MKNIFFIGSLVCFTILLTACDPDEGKLRTASLTSPNSQDARTFNGWLSSGSSVQVFNGIQVVTQNSGKQTLITCLGDEVQLIQKSVANGSEATKRCNVAGGCSATAVIAEFDSSSKTGQWVTKKETIAQNDEAGTANNINEGTEYVSGATCVKKSDLSKWS